MQVEDGKVRFLHLRLFVGDKTECEAKGGITVAYKQYYHRSEEEDYRPTLKLGLSFCSPDDNYCRAVGNDIAYGRLVDGQSLYTYRTHRTRVEDVLYKLDSDLDYNCYDHAQPLYGFYRWYGKVLNRYNNSNIVLLPSPRKTRGVVLS